MPLPSARSIDLVHGQGAIWWAPCCHQAVPRPSLWLCSHQPCCVADEETAAASLECGTWLAHEVIPGGDGSVWPRAGPHMWVVWGLFKLFVGGQRWQPSCCPTEILYLRAKSYLGHTFNSCKLQLAPLPWISSWRLQRSWDFCLTFLHPWKGRKRAQPIRAVIASAISPEPVCEWVFRKLNAMAGNHKLPPKKKKKILPLNSFGVSVGKGNIYNCQC